jgi:hypothetical protein
MEEKLRMEHEINRNKVLLDGARKKTLKSVERLIREKREAHTELTREELTLEFELIDKTKREHDTVFFQTQIYREYTKKIELARAQMESAWSSKDWEVYNSTKEVVHKLLSEGPYTSGTKPPTGAVAATEGEEDEKEEVVVAEETKAPEAKKRADAAAAPQGNRFGFRKKMPASVPVQPTPLPPAAAPAPQGNRFGFRKKIPAPVPSAPVPSAPVPPAPVPPAPVPPATPVNRFGSRGRKPVAAKPADAGAASAKAKDEKISLSMMEKP